ncbi:hypothetical protein [Desulfolutivibrio sulfoxidireducens]|uniref:hypothetical protein n=1 Tax=Desulfolutivibrio sulfoxidireducens TaxID=2773299 RepID=UPI00159D4CB1|nr:hypothetical protein [Desulfolutivibrio sulfoxidireducens]QLA14924.1 hypothetical protein GD605_01550 [Desulfolutivibrio sulfoxidireducens]QLA18490.1 hypothetical protein GD604_01485 [Desulfolutivibrio sulfoxidireducens]
MLIFSKKSKYRYNLDGLIQSSLKGWIYHANESTRSTDIKIVIDDHVLYDSPTNLRRVDLNSKHNITGLHGFSVQVPLRFFNGEKHPVSLFVREGTKEVLIERHVFAFPSYNFTYRIESLDGSGLCGWIFNTNSSSEHTSLKIFIDTVLVDEFSTDVLRTDVNQEYSIQGTHGFHRLLPLRYYDGASHTLRLTVSDSHEILVEDILLSKELNAIHYKIDEFQPYFARGWAYGISSPSQQLQLMMYLNGAKLSIPPTIENRSDLNKRYNIAGKHGFTFKIPLEKLHRKRNIVAITARHEDEEYCLDKSVFVQNFDPILHHIHKIETQKDQSLALCVKEKDSFAKKIAALTKEKTRLAEEVELLHSLLNESAANLMEIETLISDFEQRNQ